MIDRRTLQHHVTPAYEDNGLFKKQLVQVQVEMVPQVQRNLRQDVLVHAFIGETQAITVVIAGRRAKMADPLLKQLSLLGARARSNGIDREPGFAPDQAQYRLNVTVQGSWRVKFNRDQAGWEDRSFHLMAARWSIMTRGGASAFSGLAPEK